MSAGYHRGNSYDGVLMKLACVFAAFLLAGCLDGPSPRQKYGDNAMVTGSNIARKDVDQAAHGVAVFDKSAIETAQNGGSGAAGKRDTSGGPR